MTPNSGTLNSSWLVLALSMIYAAFGNVPIVEAIFLGIKAAVLVIVIGRIGNG